MAVTLRNQNSTVVDALRAVRKVDDELSRLRENSWEFKCARLSEAVSSADWRFGPADLLATFPHHIVAKSSDGSVVQTEWSYDSESGVTLGKSTIHETATPVADLGRELIETAKSAVDHILDEDYDGADPMIATLAEALDSGGDLQRRVQNEVTTRALKRDAWWHNVVGARVDIENMIPIPSMEDDDGIKKSVNDLLLFLKEAAGEASSAIRLLSNITLEQDVTSLAGDIAEDIQRAVFALSNTNLDDSAESLQVYEAVMTMTPRLLNGIAFLGELTQDSESTHEG